MPSSPIAPFRHLSPGRSTCARIRLWRSRACAASRASRRRSGHPFFIRPAPRRQGEHSPRAMPNASSCPARRRKVDRAPGSPPSARRPSRQAAAPTDILMFALMTVILGRDGRGGAGEARRLSPLCRSRRRSDPDVGLDRRRFLSSLDPDQVVEHVENDAGRTSAREHHPRRSRIARWTVRQVAEHVAIGGIGPVIVGGAGDSRRRSWKPGSTRPISTASISPSPFGRRLSRCRRSRWCRNCSAEAVTRRNMRRGTLREKLFGAGPRLAAPHPAAGYRWLSGDPADAPRDRRSPEPARPARSAR